jgi:hypothetical protein
MLAVGGAWTYESANVAGFGDFDIAGFNAFVESDEGSFAGRVAVDADHWKQKQLAALDGSQNAVLAGSVIGTAGSIHSTVARNGSQYGK